MEEKVYLKKQYIVPRTGSRYPRGTYHINSLPTAIRNNPEYVKPLTKIIATSLNEEVKSLTKNTSEVKQLNRTSYEEKPSLLNVNDATMEELINLPGIGRKSADNIASNRPYVDLQDLKKRAKLSRINVEDIPWTVAPAKIKTVLTSMNVKQEPKEIEVKAEKISKETREKIKEQILTEHEEKDAD